MDKKEIKKEQTKNIHKKKFNFMFNVPKDYVTEDIKKAQSKSIKTFSSLRNMTLELKNLEKIDQTIKENVINDKIDDFRKAMNEYTEAIISSFNK